MFILIRVFDDINNMYSEFPRYRKLPRNGISRGSGQDK